MPPLCFGRLWISSGFQNHPTSHPYCTLNSSSSPLLSGFAPVRAVVLSVFFIFSVCIVRIAQLVMTTRFTNNTSFLPLMSVAHTHTRLCTIQLPFSHLRANRIHSVPFLFFYVFKIFSGMLCTARFGGFITVRIDDKLL